MKLLKRNQLKKKIKKIVNYKYKDKKFAAGCSRDIISSGAEQLGWELDKLLEETLIAFQEVEDEIAKNIERYKQ